jgi:hypothetical protein
MNRLITSAAFVLCVAAGLSLAPELDGQQTRRVQMSQLSVAEMAETTTSDVMATVQMLRPLWLSRARNSTGTAAPVRVYIDGLPWGTADMLRTMPNNMVLSMEYIGSLEATQRWGMDHSSGVIMIRAR